MYKTSLIKKAMSLIMIVFIGGCSLNHTLRQNDAVYENYNFPAVSFSIEPIDEYITYHDLKFINDFMSELAKRNSFPGSIKSVKPQYFIRLKYDGVDKSKAIHEIWWVLTAATFFIVPSYVDEEYTMLVDVFYKDALIKQYKYIDSVSGWTNIFTPYQYRDLNTHNIFIDKLFSDLANDNIFRVIDIPSI